jgi:hypothetical protein
MQGGRTGITLLSDLYIWKFTECLTNEGDMVDIDWEL